MSTCSLGISQMASSDVHKRKTQSRKDSNDRGGDKSKENEPGVIRGVLPCVAGVAGVSLFIWVLFYLYVPPEVFSGKSLCTRISNPVNLASDLNAIADWQGFARELGVPSEEIEDNQQNRIKQILEIWSQRAGIPCLEKLVRTLNKIGEDELAEMTSSKFQSSSN